MYYDLTWDYEKMRYKCALLKILNFVTSLSFNEFKSMKILSHGPKCIVMVRQQTEERPHAAGKRIRQPELFPEFSDLSLYRYSCFKLCQIRRRAGKD